MRPANWILSGTNPLLNRAERGIWEGIASGWEGCFYFLTRHGFSKDTASQEEAVRKYPRMDYLKLLTRRWHEERLLAVPKSRRMFISWWLMGCLSWDALCYDNRTLFVASRKLGGSEELVGRCKFIIDHLTLPHPPIKTPAAQGTNMTGAVNAVMVEGTGTTIQAVEQGSDALRQFGASRVLCDEFAFWEKARQSWNALKPTIEGGGQICMVSSAAPGFMELVVHDQLEG